MEEADRQMEAREEVGGQRNGGHGGRRGSEGWGSGREEGVREMGGDQGGRRGSESRGSGRREGVREVGVR